MHDWLELETLHIVSDLHLGGRKGSQIFGSTDELEWLIGQVAAVREPGTHAILVNGDLVDFLAEEPSMHFDPDGAVAKLDTIWQNFEKVFDAFRLLLATPQRLLIVNLGNHDLELALPWVRAHLTARLTGNDEAARARLVMITDGTGVRCRIGGATIVCVHGNEVDSWNIADYEHLRRFGRDVQFGKTPEAWTPNAGTQMVIGVMNEIKRKYPFVDLLKPETEAVLPILAALDTGAHRKLSELARIVTRKARDAARIRTGFLDSNLQDAAIDIGDLAAPTFATHSATRNSDTLMRDVESAWHDDVTPISLVRSMQEQQLGFWTAARSFVTGSPKHEVLREALEQLDHDRSFDPAVADDTFDRLDALLGAGIDIVVAGHTHLERSLQRRRGSGHYFNCGTWARLMRIEPEVRQNRLEFERLFRLLDGGTLEMLDKARVNVNESEREVVLRRNTVVVIKAHTKPAGRRVEASLHHVLPASGPDPIRLEPANVASWTGG
jgi:UDP-2,3-diacylglucosamine pyrophosphatase LpxH